MQRALQRLIAAVLAVGFERCWIGVADAAQEFNADHMLGAFQRSRGTATHSVDDIPRAGQTDKGLRRRCVSRADDQGGGGAVALTKARRSLPRDLLLLEGSAYLAG